jgi:hypothetical protein
LLLARIAAVAALEFSRGFQPTVGVLKSATSRQRRLISSVADATREFSTAFPALKRRAKFRRRYAADELRKRETKYQIT